MVSAAARVDPLTHALAGAALGRATAPAHPGPTALSVRSRVIAGTLAAVFPDVDGLLQFVSPIAYLDQHRGLTHSLLMLPLWALALAWLFARVAGDPRGPRPWFGICAIGIASHAALDLITGYGTMLAAPISWHRFTLRTTFIIDLWMSGLLAAGLLGALLARRSRIPAMAACVGVVAYVTFQLVMSERAEAFGRREAVARGIADARVVAHPRPVSPLNWTVFLEGPDRVHFAHVNLLRREPRPEPGADAGFFESLDAPYRPLDDARWESRSRFGESKAERALVESAWGADDLAFFRRFADLPVFDGTRPGASCVWFFDLRFMTPGRAGVPFRYGACRGTSEGRWRAFQLNGAGEPIPMR